MNHKRFDRLLHQLGLYAKGSRYKCKYYNSRHSSLTRPNFVNLCFQATGKNKIWLGELAYIPTQEGTLFLSIFIDVYSRTIVDWAMGRRIQDRLVTDAFKQAYQREDLKKDLLFILTMALNILVHDFRIYLGRKNVSLIYVKKVLHKIMPSWNSFIRH